MEFEHRKNKDPRKNMSGCYDLTAYDAIKHISDKEERVSKLVGCLKRVCELAGFEIQGRIVLVDKETGEVWR